MKLTKRILSLCLALAMLLTVATFPAFAEEYQGKTVELKASVFAKKQSGPNIFARPADYNLKAGDSLAIEDGAVLSSAWYTAMSLTADQVKGIEIKYGTAVSGMELVYLKLESDGTMAGFYTSPDFTTPATITFETAGVYLFASQYYVNASGELTQFNGVYPNEFANGNNACLWAIEVKPADTPEATKPNKENYTIGTVGDLTLLEGADALSATTGNIAYVEDLSVQGVNTPDTKVSGDSTTPLTFIKASNTTANKGPWGTFRIDFETDTYLEKLSIKTGLWSATMYWDLYGSLDGTSWYYINSANAATVSGALVDVSVDAVVKHLRFVVTDATNLYGTTSFDVTAITGATATYNAGEEEPTTVDVTFVNVDGVTANEVVTINEGETVTVPAKYATGYKFYNDEDCTSEITDLANRLYSIDKTIYVKAIPVTPDPDPEQPTGPKTIGLLASIRNRNLENAGAKVIARPSDDIRVNDTLTIAEGQKMPAYASGSVTYYLTGDTSNTDTTKQVTGWKIRYAKSANVLRGEDCEVVYVKIAADGTLSGFYASMDDTTPTNITFEEAGIYTFASNTYIDGTGNEVIYNSVNLDQYTQGNTPFMWSIRVKEANAPVVTAPDKADYEITTGTANIFSSMTQDAVSATTGNRIYAEDVTTEGIASDGKPGDNTNPFALINAVNTTGVKEPVFGVRFDFEEVTYLEKFTIVFAWGVDNMVYDMYGSMNGEDWYILQENQTTTGTSSTTHVVNVDGVAQYFRLYIRDKNRTYGTDTNKITAISGQIGVEYIGGSSEPQVKDESGNVLFEEITDDVLATLPSYFKVGGKNYVVKSWTMDDEAIDYVALKNLTADDVTGNIVPELVEVPFDVAKLSKDATKAGEDGTGAFDDGAKYVNGLYIQGAQIRFPETNVTAGLRFVNVVDRELEATLEALVEAGTISGLDHGTLAIGNVNYDNVDLTVDNTGVDNTGDKIYKTADLFNDEYYKYTLCVTGFQPEQYELAIYVRPYITFTYGTETVYLYGEQYKTNYRAVVQFAKDSGTLSSEQESFCDGILG